MATGESCRCLAFQYRTPHIWMSVIITVTLKAIFSKMQTTAILHTKQKLLQMVDEKYHQN
jgi:hypothetical protein